MIYIAGGVTRNRIETYDPYKKAFGLLSFSLRKTGACSLIPSNTGILVCQSGGQIQLINFETEEV
jgi:hypothetical protein